MRNDPSLLPTLTPKPSIERTLGGTNTALCARQMAAIQTFIPTHLEESTMSIEVAYSALWRRFQDGWRITFAHESGNK